MIFWVVAIALGLIVGSLIIGLLSDDEGFGCGCLLVVILVAIAFGYVAC